MITVDCIQGSEEWFAAKLGVVSSSNFGKVLNKKTGRGLYMRKLAAEILSGESEESYTNGAMEDGIELEPEAREYYEQLNSCQVRQVGFITRDDGKVGSSPDGLVGDDGEIEIKCPIGSTHIEYINRNELPAIYVPQVQGQLLITERKWCDFISYCPKIRARPFFCKRIFRDEKYLAGLEKEINLFVSQLDELVNQIKYDDSDF